ncbi:MAG TPA: aminotransferase class I/II-fold pyridoxal phosphate-dependent enzyme [Acidimicrobiia bacterium]|nr:aminotransferase class I/II-fold pyridoxal phosphate-dependent enzyme [Acidimicrobiia bacterium]
MSRPASYLPQGFNVPIDLDLSKNEGSTRAEDLLTSIPDPQRSVSRYPDTSALRLALASLHGLSGDSVLVSAGGDDALFRCFLARVRPGGQVVTTYPTFEMIPRYTEQRGAELIETPWWTGAFPTDELVSAIGGKTDAVFIVSPNNPTGAVAGEADLRKVAAETPLLVVDAAYTEFASDDLTRAALELDNVLVIRTMSKAYGLAGLRVGYMLGPPELVSEVASYGNPYPVAALSAALALERLHWPDSELTGFVDEVKRERIDLTAILTDLGTRPFPSEANFVLTECNDASWLMSASAALGVGLRWFPQRRGLEPMVRITLPGNRSDFERLERTLGAALAPEAIIFDMDGVVADVSRSQTMAIIETAGGLGVALTIADIERAKAAGNVNDDWELTRGLCLERGVEASLDEVRERFEALYQGTAASTGLKIHETPIVDRATWARWADSRPLAIVTGRPRADAEEFLVRFGLRGEVSALVTREDAPLKPDPAPVRMALELLGVSRAWMLGDTPDDLVAARAAGVIPIGVVAPGDNPDRARQSLRKAARILDNTNDLEGLLP